MLAQTIGWVQTIGRFSLLMLVGYLGANQACVLGQDSTNVSRTFDWPGFLGPNRDSKSAETGILKDWSSGNLEIVWQADVGQGYVLGSVANGKFFQFDAIDQKCRLRCLNAENGIKLWDFSYEFDYKDMFQFDEGPRATPVIDNNRVFIYGVEGNLHCIDSETGAVVWKVDVNKRFGVVQNFFGVGSTPIVHGKYLIVMVGGSPSEGQNNANGRLDTVKPDGAGVVVFEKTTGKMIHKIGNDLASYSSIQLYKDGSNIRGIAWMRNTVIGFDVVSGNELWSFPYRARRYETVNASTPVVKGSEIFLSESYGPGSVLLDVSGNSPSVVWNDKNPRERSLATHWNTPILHAGHLYGCHGEGRANSEIRCVNWKTGSVNWKQRGFGRSSLVFVDDHLIVLDENGELLLLNASSDSFHLVSKYSSQDGSKLPIDYPCWASPVISNGLLYVRGKNKIVCLRLIETK